MNRWAVIACIFSLCVGFFTGYAVHRSALFFDHDLEVGDLKSEIDLEKRLLAECKQADKHDVVHEN